MKQVVILSICLLLCFPFAFSQKESKDVRAGNKLYNNEKFTDAEVFYRKGLGKNDQSFEATFNLGNALYKQQKYTEAVEQFAKAATLETNKNKIASAYHNIGNSMFQAKEYSKSIEAYKMALKQNPKDNETRYNLALAQKQLKQQQQQQQKKQDKKEQQQQNQDKKEQEKMSKENAQQLLDAFLQDEKDVQKKLKEKQQQSSKKPAVEKDW